MHLAGGQAFFGAVGMTHLGVCLAVPRGDKADRFGRRRHRLQPVVLGLTLIAQSLARDAGIRKPLSRQFIGLVFDSLGDLVYSAE